MTTASATLNAILARWLGDKPVETANLDCAGCSKVAKCCDFQPFVANFLVGAMLEHEPDVMARLLGDVRCQTAAQADGKAFLFLPVGMIPSPAYRARRDTTPEAERGEEFLCAFYDRVTRGCSVWPDRPGECSTYLCTAPNEARAQLSERSFQIEAGVAQMALAELGYSPEQISQQIDFLNQAEQSLGQPPVEEMFALYRKAWAWARSLEREDVMSWFKE